MVTRRQFGAGLVAVTTTSLLPVAARAAGIRAGSIFPAFIAGLDDELAVQARRMVRLDHLLVHVERKYFIDDRCRWRWGNYYGELVDSAQWVYDRDQDTLTNAERAFIAWTRKRIPTSKDLKRERWNPVADLSATYRWREAVLYAALMHCAVTTMALDFVSYKSLNPCYPEHEQIVEACRRAWDRLRKIIHGSHSGPWSWPRAESPADLIVLRRVWLIWKADGVFARKFLRQALARLRARGVTWIATDDGKGHRTWTWVRPETTQASNSQQASAK